MHVVIFHPAKLPIRTYGGTERVVVWLARALRDLNHRVTLIAGEGTRLPGIDVVPIDVTKGNSHSFELDPYIPAGADVAHYFVPVHRPPRVPYLWTMQGNARPGFEPGERCVFVSADHARRHGGSTFVYNGIDPADFQFRSEKRGYLLFLGRLSSVKGWKQAVRIVRAADRDIVVAGGWRPSLKSQISYAGRVGGKRKADLLANAAALVAPIEWEEPFGLVVAEALMSGTPVIGKPRGSFPEIVPPHVGGLSHDFGKLVRWAIDIPWEPRACHDYALEHFSHTRMAEEYLELYDRVVRTGSPAGDQETSM